MKKKRILALGLACTLVLSMFSGCASSSSSSSDDTSESTSEETTATEAESTEEEEEEEVEEVSEEEEAAAEEESESATVVQVQSGATVDNTMSADQIETAQRSVFNFAVANDCIDFDPFTHSTGGAQSLVGFYQPLAYMIDGEIYGVIMKDYSYSDDGLTMYGEIYDYITDSDGNNITASDVVFSYEMSEEYASLGTSGFVDTFEATGDYTFEVHFSQLPGIGKMDKLVKFFIVSETAYNEHDMHSDPVGTGPYVFIEHTSGYSFTYEKREDYWQTDTSLVLPRDMANVDQINFYVITESAQRTIALQNGSVDAAEAISTEDLTTFEESDDYWVASIPDDLSLTLVPNCDSSRLTSDVNLRKAIFYAISNEAILESVFGGRGTALMDWCPSWAVGYNSDWDNETDNYYTYDVEIAKEYLEASSYNGETLTILTSNVTTYTEAAQLVSALLDQIGIKTEISALDGSIVSQNYADVDAWDLYITNSATNTYWIDGINGALTTDKTTWDGSPTFWYEEELQDMLTEYMQQENATAENFEILRDYVLDNALLYGIVNSDSYYVVPSWCTGVCLSYKKYMTPGGNTYSAE